MFIAVLHMKKTFTYILLLFLIGCRWAEPALKRLKVCQKPVEITATPDISNPKVYTFSLTGSTTDILYPITWKIGTTVLGTSTSPNFTHTYPDNASGNTVITAEIQTVCEEKLTFNKQFLIPFITKIWDKTFGGSGTDEQSVVIATNDGGFLLGGRSSSALSGDKTENSRGGDDFWVVKINANGQKQWDKTYGGSATDFITCIAPTTDGGFLLGGQSFSNASGDKSDNNRGDWDFWVIKINSSGQKQWDKTYGGLDNDVMSALVLTSDGGFLLGGASNSSLFGEKSEGSRGDWDYWVIKINPDGQKQWDKTFGGAGRDIMDRMIATSDGGFLLGGYSNSYVSGEKSENSRGNSDFWAVKINSSGQKQWDKTFGGSNNDIMNHLLQTSDGGYLLGGRSISGASGDKTDLGRGSEDFWVVKINSNGQKQWDKTFGGTGDDIGAAIVATPDNGYLLGGGSNSTISGEKTENRRGGTDYWIFKMDENGNKQWDKTIGGVGEDQVYTLYPIPSGGFLIIGYSDSNSSGEKTENNRGGRDFWVVKIR